MKQITAMARVIVAKYAKKVFYIKDGMEYRP